ncbi:MAG: glycosyltransferase family 4 protein [Nanoarchaeota archaeon]|nr:glycosyltransferase family 4 protein [Nanoarchaeota archaeon]
MKLCINNLEGKLSELNIGPVIFAKRISYELEKLGVEIVKGNENHNILLVFADDSNTPSKIEKSRKKGAKIIQRLDGIYHTFDENFRKLNNPIKKCYEESDSIIFQSYFNKKMVERYFGPTDKQNFIIHNGVDPLKFGKNLRRNEKNIFLCSAKWRADKRLSSIVEGFGTFNNKNSELWVLGEPDYILKNDNIKYFGEVNSERLPSFYNKSDFFLHLSYDDSCSNSVVEALVSGLPVICTNNGGTKELVKMSGEIIPEKEYDLKPYFRNEIPSVNRIKVKEAIQSCLENKDNYKFPRDDLYIENCAKKYIDVFNQTLNL